MNAEGAADTAVLASAILMLVAIVSKLITANLVTRSKRVYAKVDATRKEIVSRLKEAQLKRTSARGTLEFWERRRTETAQKVMDATRDLENYAARMGEDDFAAVEDVTSSPDADAAMLEEPFATERTEEANPDMDVAQTDSNPTMDSATDSASESGVDSDANTKGGAESSERPLP